VRVGFELRPRLNCLNPLLIDVNGTFKSAYARSIPAQQISFVSLKPLGNRHQIDTKQESTLLKNANQCFWPGE
jgi:hypothetical protein